MFIKIQEKKDITNTPNNTPNGSPNLTPRLRHYTPILFEGIDKKVTFAEDPQIKITAVEEIKPTVVKTNRRCVIL